MLKCYLLIFQCYDNIIFCSYFKLKKNIVASLNKEINNGVKRDLTRVRYNDKQAAL